MPLTYEELYERIELIFKHYGEEYGRPEGFVDSIDSLEFIQIILTLEEEFQIQFDEDMLSLEVVKDLPKLAKYIESKVSLHA